jgi:hypothetical protein
MITNQLHLQLQAAEMRRLLEDAADDPILEMQLRIRLAGAEKDLAAATRQISLLPTEHVPARAAIFLKGKSVHDSEGICPSLAGEALIQYEKMFIEQALHDEREAARRAGRQRRPRGASKPGLLFTGTPRGSFGLEFIPQTTEDGYLEVHAQSLRNVAEALVRVAGSGAKELNETFKQIPCRMLPPLKKFMKTLADHGAELRLAFPDRPSQILSIEQIKTTAERLDKDVDQKTETIDATFRGLTLETGRFELITSGGDVISGTVAEDLAEDDLIRISRLTTRPCVATLEKTIISKLAGAATTAYVLIDAHEPDSD